MSRDDIRRTGQNVCFDTPRRSVDIPKRVGAFSMAHKWNRWDILWPAFDRDQGFFRQSGGGL